MWSWVGLACAAPVGGEVVVVGARAPGGAPLELHVKDGRFAAAGPSVPRPAGVPVLDVGGRFVSPAFVDSHVHLAYLPRAGAMVDGGVAAVVDLAAPLDRPPRAEGLRVRWSGPMITAVGGYPTRSWGRGGYGAEVADAEAGRAAVARHLAAGASVVKLPFEAPALPDDVVAAVVAAAHAAGAPVVAHALGEAEARRARSLGVDGLAHTPVEPLSDETVASWSGGFVVSTLSAFGGAPAAVDNLRRLRAAGAEVLYGTDFGNTRTAGIDPAELALLAEAGLDGAAILEAGTADPARRWALAGLGTLEAGAVASFLLLEDDPLLRPGTLARPAEVWIDGRPR